MYKSSRMFAWSATLRWVVALALVAWAVPVRAEGIYEVFAVYRPTGSGDPIRIPLSKGMLIPDGGDDYRLAQIVVHFQDDDSVTSVLKAFKNYSFTVKVDGKEQVFKDTTGHDQTFKQVGIDEIPKQKDRETSLYEWDPAVGGSLVAISVDAKLTPASGGTDVVIGGIGISVVKAVGRLVLMEEVGSKAEKISSLIDTDSQVLLSLDSSVCDKIAYGKLTTAPWVYLISSVNKDGKQTELKVKPEFRNGCQWRLPVKWEELVDQKVNFKVQYQQPNATSINVSSVDFSVYNLGLITTLPVISEIVSAADGTSFRDIEAISKVSINMAIPVGGDRRERSTRLAIVFPWTISANLRDFHNLSEFVALAPSVSILGGGSTEGSKTSIGLGIGVNLARAFHFSYTVSTTGEKGNYLLVGVSVPELLPLLRKGWGGAL